MLVNNISKIPVVNTESNGLAPKLEGSSDKFLRADGTWSTPYTTVSATLTTSAWSSKSQSVSVAGVTANNAVMVAPAPASQKVYTTARVYCTGQTDGKLTFSCDEVPTTNITINVIIL